MVHVAGAEAICQTKACEYEIKYITLDLTVHIYIPEQGVCWKQCYMYA